MTVALTSTRARWDSGSVFPAWATSVQPSWLFRPLRRPLGWGEKELKKKKSSAFQAVDGFSPKSPDLATGRELCQFAQGVEFWGLGFRVPYDVWGLFRMLVVSAAYIPSPAQTLKLLLFSSV